MSFVGWVLIKKSTISWSWEGLMSVAVAHSTSPGVEKSVRQSAHCQSGRIFTDWRPIDLDIQIQLLVKGGRKTLYHKPTIDPLVQKCGEVQDLVGKSIKRIIQKVGGLLLKVTDPVLTFSNKYFTKYFSKIPWVFY